MTSILTNHLKYIQICENKPQSLDTVITLGIDFLLIKQIPRGQNVFAKFG